VSCPAGRLAERCLRSPRFAITASAGRGKTAVLILWIERLRASGQLSESLEKDSAPGWHLAFAPISIRFGLDGPAHAIGQDVCAYGDRQAFSLVR
jgi:hypothetical protein